MPETQDKEPRGISSFLERMDTEIDKPTPDVVPEVTPDVVPPDEIDAVKPPHGASKNSGLITYTR